jgi:hypothetical protein
MTKPLPSIEIQASIMAVLGAGQPLTAGEIRDQMFAQVTRDDMYICLRQMTAAKLIFRTGRGVGVPALFANTRHARRIAPETRVCAGCGLSKPLDREHFRAHLGHSKAPRLVPTCRECDRQAARLKYEANRRLSRKLKTIHRVATKEAVRDQPISRTPTDHGTVIVSFHAGWRPTPNRHAILAFGDGSSLNRIY